MNPAAERELRQALQRPLPDLEAELDLYLVAATQRGLSVSAVMDPIRRRICVEWDWCHVRQNPRFENDYDLAVAIVLVLTQRALDLPIDVDIILISAILVKRGLDVFCNCP